MSDTTLAFNENTSWLRALRERITLPIEISVNYEFCPALSNQGFVIETCKRNLVLAELLHIREVADQFIILPVNEFGFGFAIYFLVETEAGYPGIARFEKILSINGEYLPQGLGRNFESVWRELSPMSHNEANREKLLRNGFGTPKEKAYFEH